MGCVEKYGIWENYRRNRKCDGVDKGGNGGFKDKWMDLGYDLEEELTGSRRGFDIGAGGGERVLLTFWLDDLVGK